MFDDHRSRAVVAATALVVERVGGERFPEALTALLRAVVPFSSVIVTAYAGLRRPTTLHHDLDEVQAATHTTFYDSGPFVLDPFFVACRNGVAPGPYRLMDLAPEGFLRSEYYETFYTRIRLVDEIGLIVRADAEGAIVVSLARERRAPRFSDADVAALSAVFPLVAAAVLRQWGAGTPTAEDRTVERLAGFGAQLLSPREREVVHLVLAGRSTRSIAVLLGCAEGTVKVHRRHAYAKLGVATQSELFAMASRYMAQT